jgi:PAS domain S-box-containing protein
MLDTLRKTGFQVSEGLTAPKSRKPPRPPQASVPKHHRVPPTAPSEHHDSRRRIAALERRALALEAELATRKVTEQDLRESREAQARLVAIVESSHDAIVSQTIDGLISTWNRRAEQIFGYSVSEAVGQPITKLLIPDDRWQEEDAVQHRIRRGEIIDRFETVRRTKGGRMIDISLTVSPIRNEAGIVVGAAKIIRDITDHKRAERERTKLVESLQAAHKEAERALEIKDQFLAVVSHELRSPLNAIVGWTHLLKTGGLDAEGTRRAIETISRNASIQNQLIADLLDVQRLASGKLRLDVGTVDLALVIEAALDTVRPAAHAKQIALGASLGEVTSIPGDPNRIQQIVWNLLSNAIKFTPDGGAVRVRVVAHASFVDVLVDDTGIGIKPEFLPYIFERVRQDASTRRKGGLGLGLAIVRHLAELHGGTVRAANRADGSGAVLRVRLPRGQEARINALVSPEASGSADVTGQHAMASLHGARILIVDDERDAREDLALVLSHCGADVTVAVSVRDAMKHISRQPPDVILSDIFMPDEDGFSLIRQIRSLPDDQGGLVPAIALTGAATRKDREQALQAGFQAHVPKPVEPTELVAIVASLTERKPTE